MIYINCACPFHALKCMMNDSDEATFQKVLPSLFAIVTTKLLLYFLQLCHSLVSLRSAFSTSINSSIPGSWISCLFSLSFSFFTPSLTIESIVSVHGEIGKHSMRSEMWTCRMCSNCSIHHCQCTHTCMHNAHYTCPDAILCCWNKSVPKTIKINHVLYTNHR